MRNLSIRAKLFGGFGVVLALLAMSAALASHGLGSVHGAADSIGNEALPSVKTVDDIDSAAWQYRALQYRWVASSAADRNGGELARLKAAAGAADRAFADYHAKLITDAADQRQYSTAVQQWQAYKRATSGLVADTNAGRVARALGNIHDTTGEFTGLGRQLSRWTAFSQRHASDTVAQAASTYHWARMLILLLAALALVAGIAIAFVVTRAVTRPVAALANRMTSLEAHCLSALTVALEAAAEGDLTHTVTPVTTPVEIRSRDELGQLSETFNGMLDKTQRSVGAYNGMRDQLAELVGRVSANAAVLSAASQQMASTSEETGRAVGEIAAAVGEVAQGAESQVRMVEETRVSVQEAARAATDSSDAARDSAEAAERARAVAQDGVRAATEATEAIQQVAASGEEVTAAIEELAQRSAQIGGIVETITGIAEQTNLLALNAAIEAARAGDQGRGFAVVAEEVRKLAEESQSAAGKIAALIGVIQTDTEKVVAVVKDSGERTSQGVATVLQTSEAFSRIETTVEEVSARVTDIAGAVAQIAGDASTAQESISGVASVSEAASASAEQVSAATQQTSASAQEIASSASELARTAEELEALVRRFKVEA